MFSKIIQYIYPPRCISCSVLVQEGNGFCGECWKKLSFITHPYCDICSFEFSINTGLESNVCLKCISSKPDYDAVRVPLKFDNASQKIIHAFKYYDTTHIAKIFAKIMCTSYKDFICDSDLIIPVPMHKWKRLTRLYNPPQLLAHEIAKTYNITMMPALLKKIKNTKSQTTLSKNQRLNNINGSIIVTNPEYIKDKNIIIVDDVMTTGATISVCAKQLKKAGANSVRALCMARTC